MSSDSGSQLSEADSEGARGGGGVSATAFLCPPGWLNGMCTGTSPVKSSIISQASFSFRVVDGAAFIKLEQAALIGYGGGSGFKLIVRSCLTMRSWTGSDVLDPSSKPPPVEPVLARSSCLAPSGSEPALLVLSGGDAHKLIAAISLTDSGAGGWARETSAGGFRRPRPPR